MNLGYARTSTIEQEAGLEAQQRDLKAAGVDKVFAEQVSSVAARSQLELALDYLRDGDVLTVTKLDPVDWRPMHNRQKDRGQGRSASHPRHGVGYLHRQRSAHAQRLGQCRSVRARDHA